jgi:environmental stress-induced protein Ves
MKICIVRLPDQIVSTWNGGKTRQLYLYPEQAVYRKTPFLFRLSSATVEAEQSDFSRLEGVRRILMPLEGTVRLHCGEEDIVLHPYEQSRFDGGVKTVSYGTCVDFNLMTMSSWDGKLREFLLRRELFPKLLAGSSAAAFYVVEGHAKLFSGTEEERFGPKDFFIAFPGGENEPCRLVPDGTQTCRIIRADLFPKPVGVTMLPLR